MNKLQFSAAGNIRIRYFNIDGIKGIRLILIAAACNGYIIRGDNLCPRNTREDVRHGRRIRIFPGNINRLRLGVTGHNAAQLNSVARVARLRMNGETYAVIACGRVIGAFRNGYRRGKADDYAGRKRNNKEHNQRVCQESAAFLNQNTGCGERASDNCILFCGFGFHTQTLLSGYFSLRL